MPRHGRSFNAAVLIPGESDDVLTFPTVAPSTRPRVSHPHAPSASDLLGSGIHLPTHLAVGVSAGILQVAGYTRYASLAGLTPVAKSTIHGVIAGPFAPATERRKKLQHDVNTVIWPCRLQWRFNYINHTDEKTTDKRNNMTDMTTI